jgi:hypothetical protein
VAWNGGEELVSWQSLEERCGGKQISGVYFLPGELPRGWQGIGFELTTSEVMVVEAAPTLDKKYKARLLIRWLTIQKIWTPTMQERHIKGEGRASHLECQVCRQVYPERCPGHQVQGEVLRGFTTLGEPTPTGGDTWLFEFVSGLTMRLSAEPSRVHPFAAELELQVLPRGSRS